MESLRSLQPEHAIQVVTYSAVQGFRHDSVSARGTRTGQFAAAVDMMLLGRADHLIRAGCTKVDVFGRDVSQLRWDGVRYAVAQRDMMQSISSRWCVAAMGDPCRAQNPAQLCGLGSKFQGYRLPLALQPTSHRRIHSIPPHPKRVSSSLPTPGNRGFSSLSGVATAIEAKLQVESLVVHPCDEEAHWKKEDDCVINLRTQPRQICSQAWLKTAPGRRIRRVGHSWPRMGQGGASTELHTQAQRRSILSLSPCCNTSSIPAQDVDEVAARCPSSRAGACVL